MKMCYFDTEQTPLISSPNNENSVIIHSGEVFVSGASQQDTIAALSETI